MPRISSVFTKYFILVIALSACRQSIIPAEQPSETAGASTAATRLVKGPGKKSALELKAVGRVITKKASGGTTRTSPIATRSRVKQLLVEQIVAENGIPRSQQEDVLREMVAPDNMDCGGASCQRVMGFGPHEVGQVLDETYQDVRRSRTLAKPKHAAKKELLLASLAPTAEPPSRRSWRFSPRAIAFRLARATGFREVKFGTDGLNISIDVKPSDLVRTESLHCHRGLCEASLNMPIKLNAEAELPLNTKINLTYSEAPDAQGSFIEQKATIDGQVRTLRIGEIVDVSIDFGAKVEKTIESGKKFVVKEVNCVGSVVCDLPMLSLSARINREGIEFAGSTKPTTVDRGMLKMVSEPKTYQKELKFADLPPYLQSLKRTLGNFRAAPDDPNLDMKWDDLVFAMTQ